MATPTRKRGPTKGSRILVKLPFGREKTGGGKPASQLVMVKQGVASALGFKATTAIPTKQVRFKTAKGTATVTRQVQGSYRRRSVKLIFATPKSIPGSRGNYKSVSLPLPSGVTLHDVTRYFHSGAGKSRGVIALVSPDGKRIQWGEAKLSGR